jgi:hypothetical protein
MKDFASLPDELVNHVFQDISLSDIRSCMMVSKQWLDIIAANRYLWPLSVSICCESVSCDFETNYWLGANRTALALHRLWYPTIEASGITVLEALEILHILSGRGSGLESVSLIFRDCDLTHAKACIRSMCRHPQYHSIKIFELQTEWLSRTELLSILGELHLEVLCLRGDIIVRTSHKPLRKKIKFNLRHLIFNGVKTNSNLGHLVGDILCHSPDICHLAMDLSIFGDQASTRLQLSNLDLTQLCTESFMWPLDIPCNSLGSLRLLQWAEAEELSYKNSTSLANVKVLDIRVPDEQSILPVLQFYDIGPNLEVLIVSNVESVEVLQNICLLAPKLKKIHLPKRLMRISRIKIAIQPFESIKELGIDTDHSTDDMVSTGFKIVELSNELADDIYCGICHGSNSIKSFQTTETPEMSRYL